MLWRLFAAVVAGFAGISTWAAAAGKAGPGPHGAVEPRTYESRVLSGPDAEAQRRDALRRARFTIEPQSDTRATTPWDAADGVPSCQFLGTPSNGTSAKFECVTRDGTLLKVKYGRNPEINAESAATALLGRLGYPTDTVTIAPKLRCYGCPRHPFFAMRVRSALGLQLLPDGAIGDGYTEFDWVSIEERFPAPALQTATNDGWAWWELDGLDPEQQAEVDAIRLLAVFLAHWDNKSENQRLVCLDETPSERAEIACARPLAMIQDLGATFGPPKANLAQWTRLPIWLDRSRCIVSMRALPFGGASFPDATISEEGRLLLLRRLETLDEHEVGDIFRDARFPEYYAGTADERDVAAWVDAFRARVRQIAEARCGEEDASAAG